MGENRGEISYGTWPADVRRERGRREARSLGDPPMRRTSALISAAPNDVDRDPEIASDGSPVPGHGTRRESRHYSPRFPLVSIEFASPASFPRLGFPLDEHSPTDVSLLLLLLLLFL